MVGPGAVGSEALRGADDPLGRERELLGLRVELRERVEDGVRDGGGPTVTGEGLSRCPTSIVGTVDDVGSR